MTVPWNQHSSMDEDRSWCVGACPRMVWVACAASIRPWIPKRTVKLSKNLLKSKEYLFSNPNRLFFLQQAIDSKHTAKKSIDLLETNHVDTLPWVAQSPDLNPMKQIWLNFKSRVRMGALIQNKKNLWERMEREWWATNKKLCKRLVHSMPARVRAVIRAKGGYTKY